MLPARLDPQLLDELRSIRVRIPEVAHLINEAIGHAPALLDRLRSIASEALIRESMLPDLDLSLINTNVAIGSLEARAESFTGLFLLFRGQGITSTELSIATPDEMFLARNWRGSEPQWWTVEGSIGYKITPRWSALVGVRRESLSMSLTHPSPTDLPVLQVPGILEISPTIGSGYLFSKLWLPYLGLEFTGPRYRASLLWAPLASPDIELLLHRTVPVTLLSLTTRLKWDLEYRVRDKSCDFLEYNYEYSLPLMPRFALQLWSRGNYMWLRDRGDFRELVGLELGTGIPLSMGPLVEEKDSETATCNRWMMTAGIGTELLF